MLFNLYKCYLSPPLHLLNNSLFGPNHGCRFTPTCSEYSKESIKKYGIIHGSWLAIRRLLRCNPFFSGGHDPLI